MPSPTCESVVDDEDLRSREQSTLLRDHNPKSDPPPPHYKNKKPPSVHSDSGYSSKTGLTSGSAGSRPSAGARPSAKSQQQQHRSDSRPPPSGALARVRSTHTTAPPSHPSAPPPSSGLAYSHHALPPRSASAAPHDQRFTLPNRAPPPNPAPTTRPQPPPVQTHPAYFPQYHHHQQQQQQPPPPPPPPPPQPAPQYPPHIASPGYSPTGVYPPGVAMPVAPSPSSYQYPQHPQQPYPQRPPQRTTSMSQRRPNSIAVPTGFPFPTGAPAPPSAYSVASPSPSAHTPISPSTPTVVTNEGTFTWVGPGPPPSAPGRPMPSRRTSVSTSRPASWYEMPPGAMGPVSSPSTVVVEHSRRRSVNLSRDPGEVYDPWEDSRRMPPPSSRPQSTRPPQQTIDMPYRGGPPPRPPVGRKSKSTTYHPNAGEPVPEVTRERPRQYSDGNVPQTASRKLQKNTQKAEAYMQEQAGKTSLQLTDDELQKRRIKDAPPTRTISKSHRSRAPSQSTSRSITESERERQAMRVSIDASGVSISGDTEGRPLDISMGEDGQHFVTIGSPSKSRQKRYITEGSTQSRASKQSFAERSRKRDSVVDAGDVENAQAVIRTESGKS